MLRHQLLARPGGFVSPTSSHFLPLHAALNLPFAQAHRHQSTRPASAHELDFLVGDGGSRSSRSDSHEVAKGKGKGPSQVSPRPFPAVAVSSSPRAVDRPSLGDLADAADSKGAIKDMLDATKVEDLIAMYNEGRREMGVPAKSALLHRVLQLNKDLPAWKRKPLPKSFVEAIVNDNADGILTMIDSLRAFAASNTATALEGNKEVGQPRPAATALAITQALRTTVQSLSALAWMHRLPPVIANRASLALSEHCSLMTPRDQVEALKTFNLMRIKAPLLQSRLADALLPKIDSLSDSDVAALARVRWELPPIRKLPLQQALLARLNRDASREIAASARVNASPSNAQKKSKQIPLSVPSALRLVRSADAVMRQAAGLASDDSGTMLAIERSQSLAHESLALAASSLRKIAFKPTTDLKQVEEGKRLKANDLLALARSFSCGLGASPSVHSAILARASGLGADSLPDYPSTSPFYHKALNLTRDQRGLLMKRHVLQATTAASGLDDAVLYGLVSPKVHSTRPLVHEQHHEQDQLSDASLTSLMTALMSNISASITLSCLSLDQIASASSSLARYHLMLQERLHLVREWKEIAEGKQARLPTEETSDDGSLPATPSRPAVDSFVDQLEGREQMLLRCLQDLDAPQTMSRLLQAACRLLNPSSSGKEMEASVLGARAAAFRESVGILPQNGSLTIRGAQDALLTKGSDKNKALYSSAEKALLMAAATGTKPVGLALLDGHVQKGDNGGVGFDRVLFAPHASNRVPSGTSGTSVAASLPGHPLAESSLLPLSGPGAFLPEVDAALDHPDRKERAEAAANLPAAIGAAVGQLELAEDLEDATALHQLMYRQEDRAGTPASFVPRQKNGPLSSKKTVEESKDTNDDDVALSSPSSARYDPMRSAKEEASRALIHPDDIALLSYSASLVGLNVADPRASAAFSDWSREVVAWFARLEHEQDAAAIEALEASRAAEKATPSLWSSLPPSFLPKGGPSEHQHAAEWAKANPSLRELSPKQASRFLSSFAFMTSPSSSVPPSAYHLGLLLSRCFAREQLLESHGLRLEKQSSSSALEKAEDSETRGAGARGGLLENPNDTVRESRSSPRAVPSSAFTPEFDALPDYRHVYSTGGRGKGVGGEGSNGVVEANPGAYSLKHRRLPAFGGGGRAAGAGALKTVDDVSGAIVAVSDAADSWDGSGGSRKQHLLGTPLFEGTRGSWAARLIGQINAAQQMRLIGAFVLCSRAGSTSAPDQVPTRIASALVQGTEDKTLLPLLEQCIPFIPRHWSLAEGPLQHRSGAKLARAVLQRSFVPNPLADRAEEETSLSVALLGLCKKLSARENEVKTKDLCATAALAFSRSLGDEASRHPVIASGLWSDVAHLLVSPSENASSADGGTSELGAGRKQRIETALSRHGNEAPCPQVIAEALLRCSTASVVTRALNDRLAFLKTDASTESGSPDALKQAVLLRQAILREESTALSLACELGAASLITSPFVSRSSRPAPSASPLRLKLQAMASAAGSIVLQQSTENTATDHDLTIAGNVLATLRLPNTVQSLEQERRVMQLSAPPSYVASLEAWQHLVSVSASKSSPVAFQAQKELLRALNCAAAVLPLTSALVKEMSSLRAGFFGSARLSDRDFEAFAAGLPPSKTAPRWLKWVSRKSSDEGSAMMRYRWLRSLSRDVSIAASEQAEKHSQRKGVAQAQKELPGLVTPLGARCLRAALQHNPNMASRVVQPYQQPLCDALVEEQWCKRAFLSTLVASSLVPPALVLLGAVVREETGSSSLEGFFGRHFHPTVVMPQLLRLSAVSNEAWRLVREVSEMTE